MIKLFIKKAFEYRGYLAWSGLLLALIFGNTIYIQVYALLVFILLFIGFMSFIIINGNLNSEKKIINKKGDKKRTK